jgi:hypothetical protein
LQYLFHELVRLSFIYFYRHLFLLDFQQQAAIAYSNFQMGAPARADSRRRSLSTRDTREAWPALVAGAPTGSHASENRYNNRQIFLLSGFIATEGF